MLHTMLNVLEQVPTSAQAGYVRPARIIGGGEDGDYRVVMDQEGRPCGLWARLAIPGAVALGAGARVLVAGENLESCYIIGVLGPRTEAGASACRLATRHGASACVVEKDGEDCIELRDAEDQVIFEYRPETGTGILTVPRGDLALRAPQGNIDLVSGKELRCRGATVNISSSGGRGTPPSSLSLEPGTVNLSSRELKVAAGRADVLVTEGTYQGTRLMVTVERAKQVFGKLETVAARIIERATDVYRQVENLHQLKAGRMRTLVKGACHIKGGRMSIKADDDVKINGRRIHLG
ncbi:MAG: DUF3540 domain-containing protein [Kiloniellaceae bacterium]